MKKPIGPKNIQVKDAFSLREAKAVSWLIGISSILLIFGLAIVSGCAAPKTHKEWATHCLKKTDAQFRACLDEWRKWELSE